MLKLMVHKPLIVGIALFLITVSCTKETIRIKETEFITEKVVIIVIDGPRYSETWGDSLKENIPHMANDLAHNGVIYKNFYNDGPTNTTSGHTAILTGFYQKIDNSGHMYPMKPSILQYFNRKHSQKPINTWIISSKFKLRVLSNCLQPFWINKNIPRTNCGKEGITNENRDDSITFNVFQNIFTEEKPQIIAVSFMGPDYWAHKQNWENYIQAIKQTDEYVYRIWELIQETPEYQDKTTLFVTNDHGRHLDSIANGYISHGDNCEGCRHINLFTSGPDFKNDQIIETPRELIDIFPTISVLLNLEVDNTKGEIMTELFK